MPKDPTKNIDRYKIRGGQLNEFDFHQNQEEFAETSKPESGGLIPGTPPEKRVEEPRPFLGKLVKKAAKVTKATKATKSAKTTKTAKAKKSTKAAKASKATKVMPRGATAKKLAARKAAKK